MRTKTSEPGDEYFSVSCPNTSPFSNTVAGAVVRGWPLVFLNFIACQTSGGDSGAGMGRYS